MYRIELKKSYFPAKAYIDIDKVTIGELLRETSARHSNEEALVGKKL
jgi:hypothetical protein